MVRQPISTTTGPDERPTDVVVNDDNADTAGMLLPGVALTLATSNSRPQSRNEVAGFPPTLMQLWIRQQEPGWIWETLWSKQQVRLSPSLTNWSNNLGVSCDQKQHG